MNLVLSIKVLFIKTACNWIMHVAPWPSGYHYCTTSSKPQFKSYSQRVRDSRWSGCLTVVPAGNNALLWSTIPQKQFIITIKIKLFTAVPLSVNIFHLINSRQAGEIFICSANTWCCKINLALKYPKILKNACIFLIWFFFLIKMIKHNIIHQLKRNKFYKQFITI